MSRLLPSPMLDGAARRLDAPDPVLDQATRELLARAEAEAYARGRSDGARDAADAAEHAAHQAVAAVTDAVDQVRRTLADDASTRADATTALGRRLAETLLGRELQSGGDALVERVAAAVATLDHGPFTVHVARVDADLVARATDGLPGDVTVEVDDRLAAGEARISGPWSGADLTRDAMLDVLLEDAP